MGDNYKNLGQMPFFTKSKKIAILSITCTVILGGVSPTVNSSFINDIDEKVEDDTNKEYKTTEPPYQNTVAFASFYWEPNWPDLGEEVTFISTSTAYYGTIVSERWTFEDGHTVYAHSTKYIFKNKSSYKVTLDVYAVGPGGSDWDTQISYVKVGADPFPRFTCTPEDPTPRKQVILNASKSNDPDGEIISYNWSYYNVEEPNNVTELGSDIVILHTWDDQGVYNIVLFVEDDRGNNNTLVKTIRVSIIKLDGFPTCSKGIHFEIINQGAIVADNVSWNVEITKYLRPNIGSYILYNESGSIDTIDFNNSETISRMDFKRRLCKFELIVTAKADNAVEVSKSFYGLFFGKYVYLSEEDFRNPYFTILVVGILLAFIFFVISASIGRR